MQIKKLVLGDLSTNCYLVIKNNKCLIIDPASNAEIIIAASKNYEVVGVLVTHHHFDHILALKDIEKYYNLKHNTYNNNAFNFKVLKTPGHTDDSLTFYFEDEKVMFTGDFLFYHTCGRCDFENSSILDMQKSLNEVKKYPDDILIYPGHGRATILGEEKNLFNLYFK